MATPQLYYKNGSSWENAMLSNYPVGAIYSSTSSTNPGSIFGDGWVQITGDACLMAGNSVGNVGSKTITTNNMPSHNHSVGQAFAYGIAVMDQYNNSKYGMYSRNTVSGASGAAWLREQYNPISVNHNGRGKTICPTATVVICGEELHKFGCDVA